MIKLKSVLKEMVSEIGDRINADNIIQTHIGRNDSIIDVKVGDDTIRVDFGLLSSNDLSDVFPDQYREIMKNGWADGFDEWGIIEVAYYPLGNPESLYKMTNRGNPLEVMSAVAGAIKEFLNQYKYYKIMGLMYDGKREFKGDTRRERLYDKFVEKNLKSVSNGEIKRTNDGQFIIYLSSKPLNG